MQLGFMFEGWGYTLYRIMGVIDVGLYILSTSNLIFKKISGGGGGLKLPKPTPGCAIATTALLCLNFKRLLCVNEHILFQVFCIKFNKCIGVKRYSLENNSFKYPYWNKRKI